MATRLLLRKNFISSFWNLCLFSVMEYILLDKELKATHLSTPKEKMGTWKLVLSQQKDRTFQPC